MGATHSFLIVGVHEVLVPSPEVRETLELGESEDREIPSVPNQRLQVCHGLRFHITGYCRY